MITGKPIIHLPEYAISVMQPWAWAMLFAEKDIENRGWKLPRKHTGKLLWLHTGQRPDRRDAWLGIRAVSGKMPPTRKQGLPFGCIVGVIRFTRNVTDSPSVWFFGPNGWVIESAVALPNPVPCKGALGFFKPDPEAHRLAVEQIKELP